MSPRAFFVMPILLGKAEKQCYKDSNPGPCFNYDINNVQNCLNAGIPCMGNGALLYKCAAEIKMHATNIF